MLYRINIIQIKRYFAHKNVETDSAKVKLTVACSDGIEVNSFDLLNQQNP